MKRKRLLSPLLVLALSLAISVPLHAHRPFEITSTGRLQHERLELTVIISPTMANLLTRDPADPEAPPVDEGSLERYRPQLLALAAGFFEVRMGDAPLAPEQILVELNAEHEPQFLLVYPGPLKGPLRLRANGLVPRPPDGTHLCTIYDDDEQIVARQLLRAEGPGAEMTIPRP